MKSFLVVIAFVKDHARIVMGAAVLLAVAGFFSLHSPQSADARPTVTVTEEKAVHADISGERTFTGVLQADAATDLAAKSAGRVTGIYAEGGSRVGRGALLVELDASTERATAESLHQSTDAAQKSLDALGTLYSTRIAGEEAPASGNMTTGSYASLTNAAVLADQISDTLGALLSVRKGVPVGATILFDNELGARDSAAKNAARNELEAYQTLNAEYQTFFDDKILNKNPDDATIAEGVDRATKVLTAGKSVLNRSYTVLLDTITSANVSDAEITQYKTSVTGLGTQAESVLKNMHDATTGVAVLKKERDSQVASAQSQIVALKGQSLVADALVANGAVYAPFSGVITAKYTERGAVVGPGTPLLAIADDSRLKLVIGVADTLAASFHVGDSAHITIDGVEGKTLTAHITKINPTVDAASRKVTIEIALDNSNHALKAGSFARASFVMDHAAGTTVPVSAVVSHYGAQYVFVVKGSKVERRVVTVGNRTDDRVEIIDGITEGDMVVTGGNAYLRDGDAVTVASSSLPTATH